MGLYSNWVFPRLLDWMMAGEPFSQYRQQLLAEVSGQVLELGFGTGLNLAHYPEAVEALTVIDPNPGMATLARDRIAASPLPIQSYPLRGESLTLPDQSFDWVVSTWTLCSIANLDQALQEVRRVLKPGGKFIFIEHGLSPDPALQIWQNRLTPLQKRIADGCHLNRPIADIVSHHLPLERVETFYSEGMPKVGSYFYRGLAVKPTGS
ncbi:MAG: class I SAM-dependent methyltransferase [Cyanobacteria bacterium]|nr:class I SAM-dependent methyltransferase [Cyanobacteriota bacterium]